MISVVLVTKGWFTLLTTFTRVKTFSSFILRDLHVNAKIAVPHFTPSYVGIDDKPLYCSVKYLC